MDSVKVKKAWERLVSLLPEWVIKDRTLFLLADQELIIHQAPRVEVHIKKERCTNCGDCCLQTPDGHTPFGSDATEKCNALYRDKDRWLCGAGPNRPFRCLADPLKANVPTCDIRYYE